ncbi:hypothetical protein SDC9_95880 [bioreactor metagenome]|uniref:Uncharacterized protein n=1 Tax=bioreactor metagenome TaxID=1076179 RepID=A0A645A7R0_9ZZZZ
MPSAEPGQDGLVEQPVGGDGAAAHGAVVSVEVGEPAAGLGDDEAAGRHVVQLEVGLGGDVDRPLRDEHVGPEVAEPADPPDVAGQPDEVVAEAEVEPAGQRGEGQRGVVQLRDGGDVAGLGVTAQHPGPGALSAGGPPPPAEGRGTDHSGDHLGALHQRDQRGPHRHAADVVLGAVDRVDDPAPARPPGVRALLTVHRVVGP